MVDADFARLPDAYFGSVSMYAGLHHFLDWRSSLAGIHPKIVQGGTVFFSEPSADFMLISGLLSAAFSYFADQSGIELSGPSQRSLRAMKNAAALRCSYEPEPKIHKRTNMPSG